MILPVYYLFVYGKKDLTITLFVETILGYDILRIPWHTADNIVPNVLDFE